jgi:hypothetical protein
MKTKVEFLGKRIKKIEHILILVMVDSIKNTRKFRIKGI